MSEQDITEVPEVLSGVTTDQPSAPRRGRGRPRGSKNKVQGTSGNGEATGNGEESGTASRVTTDEINEISLDEINGAELAVNISPVLVGMTTPVRKRSERQAAMDAIAKRAYLRWITEGRTSAAAKLPMVTYLVAPERVERYRYLIRRACDFITPVPYEVPVTETFTTTEGTEATRPVRVPVLDDEGNPTVDEATGEAITVPLTELYVAPGCRVRWGNFFTLTPELAEQIGRPDEAGKMVLSFAAVDKRNRPTGTTTDESYEADEDEADEDESE